MDKKMEIYQSAKELFKSQGFTNVSLRDIAEHAGTTIGNLTYHFPKKESILLMIQEDLYSAFFESMGDKVTENNALQLLFSSIKEGQKFRDENMFFYSNIVNFHQEFSKMNKQLSQFRTKLQQFYIEIFDCLRNNGMMNEGYSKDEYQILTAIILDMSYSWYQNSSSYYEHHISLEKALLGLVKPYFTENGLNAWNKYFN